MALIKEVPADAPFHLRATQLWTQALLEHERPVTRRRLLDEALAQFAATDMPFLRLPIQFDRVACGDDDDAAIEECRALVGECERRELPGPQMLGRMRLVQMLVRRGDTSTAMTVLHGVLADVDRCLPVGAYMPELRWVCRQAARTAGDAALAGRCLDEARRWIAAALADVPDPFRDSFLHRNPVNRLVIAAGNV
jgi:hypothetical protein